MREGLDDTLTLQRPGIGGALYRTLCKTNPIGNLNGSIAGYTSIALGKLAEQDWAPSKPWEETMTNRRWARLFVLVAQLAGRLGCGSSCLITALVLAAGCAPGAGDPRDNGLPAAQTPQNLSVAAPFVDGSGRHTWQTVGPWPYDLNTYVVLPLAIAPKVQVVFSAPYPSKFHFTAVVNSAPSVDLAEYVGSSEGPTTGYFQLISVDPQPSPARWRFTIRVPDSQLVSTSIGIGIGNVSENPIYTGAQQESPALQFALGDGGTDVSVLISIHDSLGENMVTSVPPGISCRGICNFRFIGSSSVVLKQTTSGHADYTFSGWSGDCSGTYDCTLTLNGRKRSVLATFEKAYLTRELHEGQRAGVALGLNR